MRIVVMGSGGTGGFFGAKLARAGEDVTFVARGEHLRTIQERGLTVKSATDGEWTVRAPARERLDGQPPADLVLFCVKSFDTERRRRRSGRWWGRPPACSRSRTAWTTRTSSPRILGPGHVIAGIAEVFAVIESPGVIAHALLGRVRFGEMDGKESARTGAFLEACGRAGIPAELVADPLRMLWEKYVFLVAQSGMSALTRCPAGVLRALPETRAMYGRLMDELVRLGRAAGAGLDGGLWRRSWRAWTPRAGRLFLAPPRPRARQAARAGGAPGTCRAPRRADGDPHADPGRGVRGAPSVPRGAPARSRR